ncbi:uncharacterized protein LOC141680814 [Apium graveolens]|uniref:uncharacterized protein LOC141680814 n=1 Tax=Apium graveolens TaxID=4045 RepID=UPI003D7BDBC6
MTYVFSPIMFAMWAINIVGILPTSTRQEKYCIIAIDYMTKWVEARPLYAIIEEAAEKFFLEKIILRSVAHPNGNGAIEAVKKINFQGIKKRLGKAKGRWVEELPWVLCAYRTTPRSSTGETPFRLAYGTDVLLPFEVGLKSYRSEAYNVEINNFGVRANMDFLEEERKFAHQRNIKYLLQAAQHYDSGIKKRSFGIRNLVLRELAAFMPTRQGKLQPNYEGSYKVIEIVRPGIYRLETLVGEAIKNTWHASRLRKFYQ